MAGYNGLSVCGGRYTGYGNSRKECGSDILGNIYEWKRIDESSSASSE
jgi:hypothetical protein